MELEDQWIKFYSTNVYTNPTHNTSKHMDATNLSFYRITLQGLHLIDIRNTSTVRCQFIVQFYDHI